MINVIHIQRLKYLKFLIASICFLFIVSLSFAQDATSVRILRAMSYSDGRLVIHAEIPEGQTIRQVNLILPDNNQAPLDIAPDALSVDDWLILDGGAGAVEVGAAFQSAVEPLASTISANQTLNMIIFADEIQSFSAIRDDADLREKLDSYNPDIAASACVSDALGALPDDFAHARRVLLLVGEATGNCPVIDFATPLDIIQIANDTSNYYSDLAKNTQGRYFRESIQSLNSNIKTIQSYWQRPVYLLQGEIDQSLSQATLLISLSNGDNISIETDFEQIIVSTPTATQVALPTVPVAETATVEATEQVLIVNTELVPTEIVLTDIPPTPIPSEPVAAAEANNILLMVGGAAILVVVLVMFVLLFGRHRRQQLDSTEPVPEPVTQNQLETTYMLEDSQPALDGTEFVSLEEVEASARSTLIGYLHHEETGTTYEIHAPQTILGRKEGVGIFIEGDKQISREHLRFSLWPDKTVWVSRLTRNPVLLNEKPIDKHVQLKSGDVLQLSTKLRLRYQEVNGHD